MFVCVRASMSASVRLCSRPCLYVRVRESAFVRVHIIKRPEASGRIDNDASGCVFRSRTFVMHYRSGGCLQPRELGFSDSLMYMYMYCNVHVHVFIVHVPIHVYSITVYIPFFQPQPLLKPRRSRHQ